MSSKYPFGHAVRKYGYNSIRIEIEVFPDVESALEREAELVTIKEVESKKYYNSCVGGTLSNVLSEMNPMKNPDVVSSHPSIWSTENNPMNNPESKKKMIKNQNRKRVSIEGKTYEGVRDAARNLGFSRQRLIHRLKSKTFPDWFYL